MTTPTAPMTPAWDASGKYILATTFNYWQQYVGGDTPDPTDFTHVSALNAQLLMGTSTYSPATLSSATASIDLGDGNGPQPYTYTYMNTWVGGVVLAGDQVQAIIDLLAAPPTS